MFLFVWFGKCWTITQQSASPPHPPFQVDLSRIFSYQLAVYSLIYSTTNKITLYLLLVIYWNDFIYILYLILENEDKIKKRISKLPNFKYNYFLWFSPVIFPPLISFLTCKINISIILIFGHNFICSVYMNRCIIILFLFSIKSYFFISSELLNYSFFLDFQEKYFA